MDIKWMSVITNKNSPTTLMSKKTLSPWILTFAIFLLMQSLHSVYGNSDDIFHPVADYCEGATFAASCTDPDRRIVIETAQYGRMHKDRCDTEVDVNCYTNVMGILDQRCSGRRSCNVNVVDVFQNIPDSEKLSCFRTSRAYLEVSYKCVKVPEPKDCVINLSEKQGTEGYLPSTVVNKSMCGDSNNPWIVKIAPEQKVNLFLMDFVSSTRYFKDGISKTCKVYAVIKEERIVKSDTICGAAERENLVYNSVSEELEIRIMEKHFPFLLRYEVIGCGGLQVPLGGWIKRKGDIAEIGCDGSDENKWILTCRENVWQGNYENCTGPDGFPVPVGVASNDGQSTFDTMFGSHWLTILAITAIAVTVAICILVAGIIYIKRKHVYLSHNPQRIDDPSAVAYKYGTGSNFPSNQHGGGPATQATLYDEHGIPYRALDPNNHEYLKTIERQRLMLIGQHPQQHFATINQFSWPSLQGDNNTTHTTRHGTVEHIYEMPKFDTESGHFSKNNNKAKSPPPNDKLSIVSPPPPPPPNGSKAAGGRIRCFELDPPPEAIRRGIIPSQNCVNTSNVQTAGEGSRNSTCDVRNTNNRSV